MSAPKDDAEQAWLEARAVMRFDDFDPMILGMLEPLVHDAFISGYMQCHIDMLREVMASAKGRLETSPN